MAILLVFVGLQLLDAATTLIFLARGVAEGNPVMGAVLRSGLHPALALAAAKAAACVLGWLAWKSRRHRLLRRANVFFAFCVVWNIAAILWGGQFCPQPAFSRLDPLESGFASRIGCPTTHRSRSQSLPCVDTSEQSAGVSQAARAPSALAGVPARRAECPRHIRT